MRRDGPDGKHDDRHINDVSNTNSSLDSSSMRIDILPWSVFDQYQQGLIELNS